jgi:dCMP deaminase
MYSPSEFTLYNKHINLRLKLARLISETSPCPRAKVGAIIFMPETWEVVSDGYNGPPRKGGTLCGGEKCIRTELKIKSGTRTEVGCAHAEFNAIANAARRGASTLGAWCAITHSPCLMCAKLLHHSGIAKVFVLNNDYSGEGTDYLTEYNIPVEKMS